MEQPRALLATAYYHVGGDLLAGAERTASSYFSDNGDGLGP